MAIVPACFQESIFTNSFGRTLDPFLCIVSFGESIVSHNHLLQRGLAVHVAGHDIRDTENFTAPNIVQHLASTEAADI